MSKKAILFVGGIIVVAGALVGVWVWQADSLSVRNIQPQLPDQTRSTSQIDISNWKTYHNEKYGFEVTYPPGWSLSTESLSAQNPNIVAITIEFKAGQRLIILPNGEMDFGLGPNYREYETVISGRQARVIECCQPHVGVIIYDFSDGFRIMLRSINQDEQELFLLQKILGTFKFL